MIIRNAISTDVDSILELWKELMHFHSALDPVFEMSDSADEKFRLFLIQNINSPLNKIVKVAEEEGNIVGYMMGTIKQNPPVFKINQCGEIIDACVTANHRRRQIGESLFVEMKKWFSEQGITRIDVSAAAKNVISTRFWQKMGFQPYLNHMYSYLPEKDGINKV